MGTAGAPIQGAGAEGRGTWGLLGQGGWAGCRPQGAGVADGRAWESRQAPWPCGGVGHDGGCAKAETGVVGGVCEIQGDRTQEGRKLEAACVQGVGSAQCERAMERCVSVPWSGV